MRESLAFRYAIICLATHVLFITASLISGWRGTPLLEGDAMSYVTPANNLIQHGVFSREDHPPYLWEPDRTPGYPVLIAASVFFFGGVKWGLYVAAITAALAGWSVVRLTQIWGGNLTAQHWAGVLSALLPNSLGLSSELLTDAVFGHLTVLWICLLVMVFQRGSPFALAGSALVLAVLQAVKPTIAIAAIFIIGIAFLFRGRKAWMITIILIACSLPVPAYFSVRNLQDHGVFSPTLLGVETARQYLQVRHMQETTGKDFESLQTQVRKEDLKVAKALSTPDSFYGRLYIVEKSEVVCFLQQHPLQAVRLMFTEMVRQFIAPQEFSWRIFWGDLPTWARGAGSFLTLVLWAGALWGSILSRKNGNWQIGFLTFGILIFFLITGSVSHFVGARLRFPADLVALPTAAIGLGQFFSEHFARRGA